MAIDRMMENIHDTEFIEEAATADRRNMTPIIDHVAMVKPRSAL